MPYWVEGLGAAYAIAAVAVGIVVWWATDLPWWLKAAATVLWPGTLLLVLWSVAATRLTQ